MAVVLALAVVSSMLGLSATKISQASMSSTSSNKDTIQAQSYARSKAEVLRSLDYEKLVSSTKTTIPSSDNFKEEVSVAEESTYPDNPDIKQKECIIRVYKDKEALPRSTIKLTRYSVAQSQGAVTSKVFSIPQNGSVTYTLPGNISHLSVFAITDFTPHNGSNTTNTLTMSNVGTLTMSTYSDRHGSKGYGYCYPTSSSASGDYDVSLSAGTTLSFSTSVTNPFKSSHSTNCINHTIVFLSMS